jgi:hypothetical protein
MRSVEITRPGDRSVADHLADMESWLERAGIRGTELRPVHILHGRVVFSATFQEPPDADRFLHAFGDASPEPRGGGRNRGRVWRSGWPQ